MVLEEGAVKFCRILVNVGLERRIDYTCTGCMIFDLIREPDKEKLYRSSTLLLANPAIPFGMVSVSALSTSSKATSKDNRRSAASVVSYV